MAKTKKESKAVSSKKSSSSTKKPQSKKQQNLRVKEYFSKIKENVNRNRALYSRYLIITGIVVLVGLFAFWKKDWFVVAMVNNQPITSVEFYQNLKAKSGQEVIDQIIRDKIISQEASTKGVVASPKDIDDRVKEIEDQIGGKDQLKSALTSRNISESDFRNQIKTQILVEKLLEKEIQVSEKEIDEYIAKNPEDQNVVGADTKDKKVRDEIKKTIRSNKLNEKFQSWYSELEKKAKITKFI
jgi:parvulin-like peptidyl-prolyl isomerase